MLHWYRRAARQFRTAPLFSMAIVLTIAVGLGATTMILAIVDGILIEPLPFGSPRSLVTAQAFRRGQATGLSLPDFLDLGERVRDFTGLAGGNNVSSANLAADGVEPEHVPGVRVTANFFRILGVTPRLGRAFRDEDGRPGAPGVVVVSAALWRRVFGADSGIVGRPIQLDGQRATVVGVLPPGRELPLGAEVWTPLQFSPADRPDNARGGGFLRLVVARLSRGRTLDEAQREVDAAVLELRRIYAGDAGLGVQLHDLREALTGPVRLALLVAGAAVALLLLVALANVANLYLVRSARRQGELAVRVALGARTPRLVGEQLAEVTLLAALGAAVGVGLGSAGLGVFRRLAPNALPRLGEVAVSGRVVAVAVAVTALTSQALAALPALHASTANVAAMLRAGGREGEAGLAARRWRNAGVIAQLALAVAVLITATLLVRSLRSLLAVDLGFRPAGVISFELDLLGARYRSGEELAAFEGSLEGQLRRLPGVRSVGITSALPLSPANLMVPYADADGVAPPVTEQPTVQVRVVSPDYFATLGTARLAGRGFDERDATVAPPVAIVSRSFVRAVLPGQDPLGHRLVLSGGGPGMAATRTIVGVVADARLVRVEDEPVPTVYVPLAQAPRDGLGVLVRTDASLSTVAAAVRRVVRELDPALPVTRLAAFGDVVRDSLVRQRLFAAVLAAFGAAAFLLTAGGLYSVTALAVGERRREFAIRAALGASSGRLIGGVLVQSAGLGATGLLIGSAAAALGSRLDAALLFGVHASDPFSYLFATFATTLLVVSASLGPARRAAATDPVQTMREG